MELKKIIEEKTTEEMISKNIAGEIVLSKLPGKTIQRWRDIFKISQRALAQKMNIVPSVISDYETGRRTSPGVSMIKKIVNAFIELDRNAGSVVINEFSTLFQKEVLNDAIIDIRELEKPVTVENFNYVLDGVIIVGEEKSKKPLYGYTVVDSIKAIVNLSPQELVQLYGMTTERALIFVNVESGRSPMVALKVTNLKPGAVVLFGVKDLDVLAKRIALVENIPLIVSKTKSIDDLLSNLKKI